MDFSYKKEQCIFLFLPFNYIKDNSFEKLFSSSIRLELNFTMGQAWFNISNF